MGIARRALFVSSNPRCMVSSIHINLCMESLFSSMGLNRTFQWWVLQKSSFYTSQLFVPIKPVSWHRGMEGVLTATPEQLLRSSCPLSPLPPSSSLGFPVFQFSLVVLILQHKLFISFARDYCKGSGTPCEAISSLTLRHRQSLI